MRTKLDARRRPITRFRRIGIALATAGVLTVAALVWTARNGKAPAPRFCRGSSLPDSARLPERLPGGWDNRGPDYKAGQSEGPPRGLLFQGPHIERVSAEAAEIGRQLGVDAVIEGTVRVASGRTRASVHAIDTRTADTLWAEDRFEAGAAGLLTMERQLAEAVALRFRGQLTATERGLIEKSGTSNAGIRNDQPIIDDSVRWRFWLHSAVDAQRMDGDSGMAGVPGISARTRRRGKDTEIVGAAQARSQGVYV